MSSVNRTGLISKIFACLISVGPTFAVMDKLTAAEPPKMQGKASTADISLKFGDTILTIPSSAIVSGLPTAARGASDGAPVRVGKSTVEFRVFLPPPTKSTIWRDPNWKRCFRGIFLGTHSGTSDGYASTSIDWQHGSRTLIADGIWRMDNNPNDPRVFLSTYFEIDQREMTHSDGFPVRFVCRANEIVGSGRVADCVAGVLVAPNVIATALVRSGCLNDPARELADLPVITRDVLQDTLTYLRPRINPAKQ